MPDKNSKFDSPITVDSGDWVDRFETPAEIHAWCGEERGFWTSLRGRAPALSQDPQGMSAWQVFQQRLNGVLAPIDNLAGRDASQGEYASALSGIANAARAKTFIPSMGRVGNHIRELAKDEPDVAARVAICYSATPVVALNNANTTVAWLRAAALAEAISRGLVDPLPSVDAVLANTMKEWSARFTSVEQEQRGEITKQSEITSRLSATAKQSDEELATIKKTHGELAQAMGTRTDECIAAGEQKIAALIDAYNTQMAVQAPTTYWKKKRDGHRWAVVGWSIGFVAVAGASAWGVWLMWRATVFPMLDASLKKGATFPNYGFYLPTIAVAFVSVWVLRLLSRQILANLALSSDAGERVAMVMTFLSLMQKPEHVKEADRILILGSLFRPATQVSDDAAPPNWFDLVMERIKPRD